MKKSLFTILLGMMTVATALAQKSIQFGYPYTQVPFTSVKLEANTFWGDRLKALREVTIPLAFSKCQSEGRYANFERAAHPSSTYNVGKLMGFPFDDTDVYKTIEGASYILQTYPDKKLKVYIDSIINIIAKAQEPDGYLYTARTQNPEHPHPWSGSRRWESEEEGSHELYDLGHLVDAACAHYQATGSTKLLNIARRYADCVVREVGPGLGQARIVPGHQIAEMALSRLYVLTGDKKYLDEAKYFLDYRGKTKIRNAYSQSDRPVVDQKEAEGHAVRAGYMYSGMADVAALTGDSAYVKAIDAIWNNIVSKKYYLTGGVGSRHDGEAFGANYELPNLTAYNETCAAIAQCYFNERMFLLHGDAKYIDCLERTLYNGVISGLSVDGGKFFYPNPLSSDGKYAFNADGTTTRQPWFGCACCPSNLCRFIPSVPGYIYCVRGNDLYLNLFASNISHIKVNGKEVVIQESTRYPWDGDIAIKILKNKVGKRLTLKVRIPGWVRGQVVPSNLYSFNDGVKSNYYISVNGKDVSGKVLINGYLPVSDLKSGDIVRVHFDMQPRTVVANPKVAADRGKIAVERGPLVYCAEWADNGKDDVWHDIINEKPQFTVKSYDIKNMEGDGKTFTVMAIMTPAQEMVNGNGGKLELKDVQLTLIPYYAWNHRGAGYMEVWMNHGISVLDHD